LSNSDVDRQEALVGGVTREFFEAVGRHYGKPVAWAFEPHIAEQTFGEMLSAARVQIFFDCGLARLARSGSRIESFMDRER
jgi:FAD dependent oxidoreductase